MKKIELLKVPKQPKHISSVQGFANEMYLAVVAQTHQLNEMIAQLNEEFCKPTVSVSEAVGGKKEGPKEKGKNKDE